MPIALGTYIVFARSSQPTAENTGNDVTAVHRCVGLVVDEYHDPVTGAVELSVQTVSRAGTPAPLPFAIPIAGPTECGSAGGEASILRVDPECQRFPWDSCVQWMTREHAALLRVDLQHDDHTARHGSKARCRLTSASLLRFAEVAEEGRVHQVHKEADPDDIAEAVPAEIWFDLGLADVDEE
ncbi:hypothetical protein H4582DRAFT_164136 [Lactarius indigo]|nr:hypothetical protein H4582DRAFT_164136 [Lactarius indigo]